MSNQSQSFNDGVVKIYEVSNISEPGGMPKEGLVYKQTLRFKNRTVGFNRFYVALQNNQKVAFLIRCQQVEGVFANDVAILKDDQYRIVQIQYPEELKVMDLTLEKVGELYDVK